MTVDIVHQKALCVFMNVVVAFWMYCKTVRMQNRCGLYTKCYPTQSCVTTCDQFKNKQHLRLKKVWVFQFCLLCSSRVLRDYKKTGASGHMLKLNVCERMSVLCMYVCVGHRIVLWNSACHVMLLQPPFKRHMMSTHTPTHFLSTDPGFSSLTSAIPSFL